LAQTNADLILAILDKLTITAIDRVRISRSVVNASGPAILHLREEETMLTPRVPALPIGDEWGESREPLLAALEQILRDERVGKFL